MSGITGAVDFHLDTLPADWMQKQSRVFHLAPGVVTHTDSRPGWAAARHLNVRIDAVTGQGPFVLSDNRYLVGEALLKNREDLLHGIPSAPRPASQMTDMEILARVVQHHGVDAVHRLKGYFAFALWCPDRKTLHLARDRTGDRTIFYASNAKHAAFGTLPTALLDLPFVNAKLDEKQVAGLLIRQFKAHSRTLFQDVFQVPPGSHVTLTPGGHQATQYWDLAPKELHGLRTRQDYAEALRETLDQSVAYMTRFDGNGNIGIGLSGGLDSTAVAALAAPRLAARGKDLTALMMIPAADEMDLLLAKHAKEEIARAEAMVRTQPNMRLFFSDGADSPLLNGVEDLNRIAGHPFLSSARWYALHPHFELCSQHNVGALLTGGSGNTTISAAPKHYYYRLMRDRRYLRFAWAAALRLTARQGLPWKAVFNKLRGLFLSPDALKQDLQGKSFDTAFGLSQNLRRLWMPTRDDWYAEHGLDRENYDSQLFDTRGLEDGSVMADWRAHKNSFQGVGGWMHAAIRIQYGVEIRDVPGDADVWEFCCSIPEDILFHPRQRRHLIRRAMRGRVPDRILDQKGKGYAAVAISKRLADGRDVIDEHLNKMSNSPLCRRAFDQEKLRELAQSIPKNELGTLVDNYKFVAGLTPALSVGAFVHWAEIGRPMNGLSQTRVKAPDDAPLRPEEARCDDIAAG